MLPLMSMLTRFLMVFPLLVTTMSLLPVGSKHHPYYVSVTEIEYIQPDKELQIAVKIFADDFESALKGMYQTKVDLFHPQDKAGLDKKITGYIQQHLRVKVDEKPMTLQFQGYEIEGEAAWCYFSAPQPAPVKNIEAFNNLLYEYKREQINIMHIRVEGVRKSTRLSFPETAVKFSF
ncbi:MAG: hypothetical protein IT250_13895 [Chitinophagaceae bacterium]|nr:hypothetical protein [Chitinophagaceae bacterium]